MDQRWLSLNGLCATLQVTPSHALWLVKQGIIVAMPGRRGRAMDARYLDPTPEYAAKLQLGEALYGRLYDVPKNLDMTGLLTVSEVSVIMGWEIKYTRLALHRAKVPALRMGTSKRWKTTGVNVYTVAAIRDFLWRRKGRKVAPQRAPFLIQEIIAFFSRYYLEQSQEVPTDAQFAADDLLRRKLERLVLMKSPEAMREFYASIELAKEVVRCFRSIPNP